MEAEYRFDGTEHRMTVRYPNKQQRRSVAQLYSSNVTVESQTMGKVGGGTKSENI